MKNTTKLTQPYSHCKSVMIKTFSFCNDLIIVFAMKWRTAMKTILFLLILTLSSVATGDTVKKWTDETGKVHYGDKKSAEHVKGTETLRIKDTFDQQSYDEGIERHRETAEFADKQEKERLKEEEKQRGMEEKENEKKSSPSARPGGTAVVPNPVVRSLPIPNRPSQPVNRPVQLPAK
jgi:hypothetical protein